MTGAIVKLGNLRLAIMAAAILISCFGCINGMLLAGARVYYAMAKDGLFFAAAGTTNRQHVPAIALAAQGAWAALLTLPVTVSIDKVSGARKFGNLYSELLEFIIPADLSFYALMVGAVILLRRKAPGLKRPYRTPGYPAPALIFIGLALFGTRSSAVSTDGLSRLIVGGAIWSRSASTVKAASTAPAAPRRCPIDDLVEDIAVLPAAWPSSRSTAPSSISSPSGVEVPWALM